MSVGDVEYVGVLDGDDLGPEIGACIARRLTEDARLPSVKNAAFYTGPVEYSIAVSGQ